eukprot:675480-Hanusia_phi.AAC.2
MPLEKAQWLARLGCVMAAQDEDGAASQSDREEDLSLQGSSEIRYVRAMHQAQNQSTDLLRTLFHMVVNQRKSNDGFLLEECLQAYNDIEGARNQIKLETDQVYKNLFSSILFEIERFSITNDQCCNKNSDDIGKIVLSLACLEQEVACGITPQISDSANDDIERSVRRLGSLLIQSRSEFRLLEDMLSEERGNCQKLEARLRNLQHRCTSLERKLKLSKENGMDEGGASYSEDYTLRGFESPCEDFSNILPNFESQTPTKFEQQGKSDSFLSHDAHLSHSYNNEREEPAIAAQENFNDSKDRFEEGSSIAVDTVDQPVSETSPQKSFASILKDFGRFSAKEVKAPEDDALQSENLIQQIFGIKLSRSYPYTIEEICFEHVQDTLPAGSILVGVNGKRTKQLSYRELLEQFLQRDVILQSNIRNKHDLDVRMYQKFCFLAKPVV